MRGPFVTALLIMPLSIMPMAIMPPALMPLAARAQEPAAQKPIAYVPIDSAAGGVKVSGALDVANGRASIGANGTITAGDRTASIALARGGQLRVCSTTTLHLTADRSVSQQDSTALLIALDRGALEASFVPGKYSDVLLTPDFRILVSGPGTAELKVRVSSKGDTCIDNHGAGAPYVTVSSQFDNGAYRVQPNQRVLFEHGSLHDVVDNEREPCGCPPPALTADSGAAPTTAAAAPATGTAAASPAKPASSTTEFPLAVSEGLAPPPPAPTTPVAAPGEVHVQVTVPLAYNGTTGTTSSAANGTTTPLSGSDVRPAAATYGTSQSAARPAPAAAADASPALTPTPAATAPPWAATPAKPKPGVFHRIGRFFSKLFAG